MALGMTPHSPRKYMRDLPELGSRVEIVQLAVKRLFIIDG